MQKLEALMTEMLQLSNELHQLAVKNDPNDNAKFDEISNRIMVLQKESTEAYKDFKLQFKKLYN